MATIAFIGLGNMGQPMALNLLKQHALRVFDLVDDTMASLSASGATAADSISDAVAQADAVITMLPAGQHVREVYLGSDGLLSQLSPGALIIDCSTIDADTAIDVHHAAHARQIDMLDAPVSGGVAAAKAGTLTFMCGGSDTAFERGKVLLGAMGANIFHAGKDGAGQVAKMCNNMLLAIHMIGSAEALKLGEKNGLDAGRLSEIMLASSGSNWSLEKYNPYPGVMPNTPASNNYQPGFMVDLMVKDLTLAITNGKACQAHVSLGELALDLYQQKQQSGDGRRDFSSIIELM